MHYANILTVHPRDEVVKLLKIEIRVQYLVHDLTDDYGIVHLAMLVHQPLRFLLELLGTHFVASYTTRIQHAPRGNLAEPLSEQL